VAEPAPALHAALLDPAAASGAVLAATIRTLLAELKSA
jgi:hypothetical protein